MSRCSGGTCSCRLIAGDGITITGTGSATDPFRIEVQASAALSSAFSVLDTQTVDMTVVGSGTSDDPLLVSADATVRVNDLTDVDADAPTPGDTIVFNGTRWVSGTPAPIAPGAVNVGEGLEGDGSVSAPLAVAVSDPGETSTDGLGTYIDSTGALRAIPPVQTQVDWADVINEPAYFPTTWTSVANKPAQYPDSAKIGGATIYKQAATPGGVNGDIWLKTS